MIRLLMIVMIGVSCVFSFTLNDVPEGWASQGGGTTGGQGGTVTQVSTMSQLQTLAKASGKQIIVLAKGTYTGNLVLSSDKTIVGNEPGVLILGNVSVHGVSNVILRNFAVQYPVKCTDINVCKSGTDAFDVEYGATHVWVDHCDISDGQDGNLDMKRNTNFVTVTWCKFHYTYDKPHAFSCLIGHTDDFAGDAATLKITYAYCWFADRVYERAVRARLGMVHEVNCLLTSANVLYGIGPSDGVRMLIENNVFNLPDTVPAIKDQGGSGIPVPHVKSIGNIGTAKDVNLNIGTLPANTFTYTLSKVYAATEVDAAVRPAAGNTMTLGTTSVFVPTLNHGNQLSPIYLSEGTGGWKLHNPGVKQIEFIVTDLTGKVVAARSTLQSGMYGMLPQSHSVLFVHLIGSSGATIKVPASL